MIYTVHVQAKDAGAADARFVPERFSWAALVFGPLWLIYHRVWRGLIGWVIVASALAGLGQVLHLAPQHSALLSELLAVYLGFEGNNLLRAALERRNWPLVDVVSGRKLEEAELSFYQRWSAAPRAQAPAPAPLFNPPPQTLGLFAQGHAL